MLPQLTFAEQSRELPVCQRCFRLPARAQPVAVQAKHEPPVMEEVGEVATAIPAQDRRSHRVTGEVWER